MMEKVMDNLKYKGYEGSVEYSQDEDTLMGKVLGIRSCLLFRGDSLKELKVDFEDMIDEYLDDCKELGFEPEKPFKGTLSVRIGSELHRNIDSEARRQGISINRVIKNTLSEKFA